MNERWNYTKMKNTKKDTMHGSESIIRSLERFCDFPSRKSLKWSMKWYTLAWCFPIRKGTILIWDGAPSKEGGEGKEGGQTCLSEKRGGWFITCKHGPSSGERDYRSASVRSIITMRSLYKKKEEIEELAIWTMTWRRKRVKYRTTSVKVKTSCPQKVAQLVVCKRSFRYICL